MSLISVNGTLEVILAALSCWGVPRAGPSKKKEAMASSLSEKQSQERTGEMGQGREGSQQSVCAMG